MKLPSVASGYADVETILRAIGNSPIVMRRTLLEALLADWENTRRSSGIDEVILAWIAREAAQHRRARLS
ncbi:MAG TPA: hypothetical protein VH684_20260 [Xanthobacteraceae bacterium]|jgi:hypothetical protein